MLYAVRMAAKEQSPIAQLDMQHTEHQMRTSLVIRYDTIGEFNVDSKAEYSA